MESDEDRLAMILTAREVLALAINTIERVRTSSVANQTVLIQAQEALQNARTVLRRVARILEHAE